MRFILLIPTMVLFLSNVPFMQKAPMEQMMQVMMKENSGCCKKNAVAMGMQSCHQESSQKAGSPNSHPKGCCGMESTCVWFCCFQSVAPAPPAKFQLTPLNITISYTGFLTIKWKDPHIAAPWQPPDFV